ncbi:Uncharacterised protein [Vibrio cholerae]|uniref:Uncharacterized protein n=1 Tax=Vibrio cholerae TaxID=666 RepID=A0A655ZMR1_VIBCL|nr:Uncharacterised protein [Vibrio cholerae]
MTNTVQTSDTLLKQIRVERQIEHHQLVRKLEVTTFGADFTTDQHLRAALFLGKVSSGFIAFNDRHAFMEYRCADTLTLTQCLL